MMTMRLKRIEDLMEEHEDAMAIDYNEITFCYGIQRKFWDELLDKDLTTFDNCAPYRFKEDPYGFFFPDWAVIEVKTDDAI